MLVLGLVAQLSPVPAGAIEKIPEYEPSKARSAGPGDATVIAVIDNAFTPYHWD